jgi:hypothetical protein
MAMFLILRAGQDQSSCAGGLNQSQNYLSTYAGRWAMAIEIMAGVGGNIIK